jgi:hypothetical protein
MSQAHALKIVAFRVVFAFIGTLLIIHTLPMYAQAPSFQRAVAYGAGGYAPISAALGDLNGDGILDIVVANQCVTSDSCPSGGGNVCTSADFCSHGAVGVLLGNGDGTFRPAVTYETSGYLSFSVALGDLNGDGKLDLVVVNDCGVVPIDSEGNCPYATVDVMFGNGDGTFGPPVSHQLDGWQPVSVALRDLNGDGKSDIVVADICNIPNTCSGTGCTCTTGLVEVLLNESNGIFSGPIGYDSGAPFGRSVALGDVNRDGKLDVLVGNDGGVGVLLGNGDGTFKPAVMYGAGGQWIAVGDVNSDGKPDLLSVASQSIGIVDVLLGNGDGTFKPAITYPTGGEFARSVAVADVNGDGKPDLVVANLSGIWPDQRAVGVLTGNGDGTFQPAVTFDSGGGTFSLAAGDLNKDGRPDVVVVNMTGLGLSVLLNNTGVKSSTSTTLTSSLNPSVYGQKVTWTATVTSSGSITPTGRVNFTWDGYSIGSATLNASGVATLTRSNLNADLYPLTAVYSGDVNNLRSTSATVNQVVTKTTSAAKITSTPNPSTLGQAVTFMATITSPTVIPTGPVTFMVGTKVLGTAQLSSSKAKFTTSTLPVGSTKVTAIYSGDSNIAKSSASVIQTVQ